MTCVEEGVKEEQAHVHNWVSWERGGEGGEGRVGGDVRRGGGEGGAGTCS